MFWDFCSPVRDMVLRAMDSLQRWILSDRTRLLKSSLWRAHRLWFEPVCFRPAFWHSLCCELKQISLMWEISVSKRHKLKKYKLCVQVTLKVNRQRSFFLKNQVLVSYSLVTFYIDIYSVFHIYVSLSLKNYDTHRDKSSKCRPCPGLDQVLCIYIQFIKFIKLSV